MDPNELLKLLDLKAKPPPVDVPAGSAASPDPPAASKSPTALEVDEWGLRRGRDLVAESERLQKAGTDAFAAADFFAAGFEPQPRLTDGCVDPKRHQFLTQLLDTPEYRSLHTDTQLDDTAAAIAAGHFAEQFAKLKKEEREKGADPSDVGGSEGLADEMAALRAVGKAVTDARKDVEELRDAASALGMGPGQPGSNDPRAIAELYRRVRKDPALRRISELAGRFRRVAASKQRRKVTHGLDDVVGVEPGGDIGRLLPSELARLAVPELELDTLRRIVEHQALCREHHAVEPVGKGPILVVTDESGSMEGPKAHTAKALALALAWVARQQHRWAGLIAYSGGSGERLLALPHSRWNESALCDWLSNFIGGGSDLDVPINELPRMYREIGAPAGITDLVMVTDARCRIPLELKQRFLDWRQSARVRAVALVIGSAPGDLEAVCDECHRVNALDPAGDAVGHVLSL
ncbi:Uncharacterized protein containing a von Willebrand factor type A domain OS=Solibacillus silvestris (strain StLB046) GN=SSIL_2224 PE=4 SV=1: VWA_2 [Gemmataceae bacterium]|nr:Uncharacterized protein containing a von Willebrand factor type A domain OS=Solibacillus silvestris (strain StLB046) GN=SSIL_2224 PE=4 SV=1: VWA_2 [Gemmataceae bacterium]VTT98798.1 Uncharacterized protein containing a von Willebrand factor type A domain OS=Solibacillus silvestris (strain StLB046) GN=SSIL_2224 PE=4 SV=1: VWA_2 [Gemmataceae bacterium]